MIQVYVLRSKKTGIYYVGMTADVVNRLQEHNAGKTKFTKGHRPWELLHVEATENWEMGRKREKYLKSSAGKRWLRNQGIID